MNKVWELYIQDGGGWKINSVHETRRQARTRAKKL